MSETPAAHLVAEFQETFRRLQSEVARVVIGHDELIENILIAFFAGGHTWFVKIQTSGKEARIKSTITT